MQRQSPRVRFAPSPTGFLHIGGVRTALFNWLYARGRGGQFLLRIEDTDLERSEKHYTDDILSCLRWLGLNWDEEIVFQSQRLGHYREVAEEWIKQGKAYRCTCSPEDVEKMREGALAMGKKPKYDGTCREAKHLDDGRAFVIRARLPQEGTIEFHDMIHGDIHFSNADLDDFVLIRTSGAPTYNFSVVVDDVEMRMTHVIRGDDHINNTPKQVHLYRFFESPLPIFAHLPMILGPDKKKLSKRHGDVSANVYRGEGYLPEALLNFLVRLGWSHGDQEIFSIEEMCKLFDFAHVQKSAAVFNQEKLLWLCGLHLRTAMPDRVTEILNTDFKDILAGEIGKRASSALGTRLVALAQQKVKLLKDLADQIEPLCNPALVNIDSEVSASLKWNKKEGLRASIESAVDLILQRLRQEFERVGQQAPAADPTWGQAPSVETLGWTLAQVEALFRETAEARGIKLGELAEPVRLSVTGRLVSPGLFEVIHLLPWDVVERRLARVSKL